MEAEEAQIKNLQNEIKLMQDKHQEILRQIAEDAQKEKDQIQQENSKDIQRITDFCLKSKADLQLNKT